MPAKTHYWIALWILLSTPVMLWDSGFVFMRPRSFEGGDLHWLWKPYALQAKIELGFSEEAYANGDGFLGAAASLNVLETLFNLYYVYLQHVAGAPSAPLIGFTGALMTLSKSMLYLLQEYFCGWCAVGHNNFWDLVLLWIIPNGLWLFFPALIVWTLGKDIVRTLRFTDKLASGKKN